MHFLLIHSPLVTKETWLALVVGLEAAGFQASVVALDNNSAQDGRLFEHHIAQIESALSRLTEENVIAVAHSGGGNLLALLDPDRFEGHVFLDATFPIEQASRFELFDNPAVAKSWQNVADQHSGMLPRSISHDSVSR
jgi:pimeloyl-ACP methyl ester carboxylesterase